MRLASTISASLLATSLLVAGASSARADESMPSGDWQVHPSLVTSTTDTGATTSTSARTETHWYGWQNLTVDAGALVMFAGAGGSSSGGLAWTGLGTYLVGSGIVHLGHDRPGAAIGSVLLRAAAPVLGGAIGGATSSCSNGPENEGFCQLGAIAVGVVLGAVVAVIVDDAVIANEEVAVENDGPRMLPTAGIVPAPDGRSMTPTLGLAGVF